MQLQAADFDSPRQGAAGLFSQTQRDVVLVTMPYASLECPSTALGVLLASLKAGGINSEAVYANLLFADYIGLNAYRFLNIGHRQDLVGEWTFAGAAFPGFEPDASPHLEHLARYFLKYYERKKNPDSFKKMLGLFQRARRLAGQFVDELARAIAAKKPRVVGASSSFEQHLASLALLRRVRELCPDTVTLLGGANCESEMGLATIRHFPWLDVVFSGEADSVLADMCRLFLAHGRQFPSRQLPEGALDRMRAEELAQTPPDQRQIPRLLTMDMDAMPLPDYGDFMATLARTKTGPRLVPGLMLETSRGCWWGNCSFCGLNGRGKRYRSKSPARIMREIETLARENGVKSFGLSDTVISKAFWSEVLPRLAENPAGYNLFFETRSNLSAGQVELLRRAGVRWVQPGIEGLDDRVLKLMNKGVTTMDNVRMLKLCRGAGIFAIWHLLVGFPGEDDAWHRETAQWLPLIFHLQPVQGVKRIRFDRFCRYQQNPAEYGISIEPFEVYRRLFPLSDQAIWDLAYYFRDTRPESAHHFGSTAPPGIAGLRLCQNQWHRAFYGPARASLTMTPEGEDLLVQDTRPCAPAANLRLCGARARVLSACAEAATAGEIEERAGGGEETRQALAWLGRQKLVLGLSGRYLALPLLGRPPALPGRESFPMGSAPIPLVDEI